METMATLDSFRELNVKETKSIFDVTPIEQAIMLVGVHGIGKSQFIESYYKEKGYKVITLFLRKIEDASDLTGMPFKKDEQFNYVCKEFS
jgi:predicted AAA+ superfamily ATPase